MNRFLNTILLRPEPTHIDVFGFYWTTAKPETWSKDDILTGTLILQRLNESKFGLLSRDNKWVRYKQTLPEWLNLIKETR